MKIPVIIRGGGDLASGVVLRLHRAGIALLIVELEKPLAVRRTVSFAEVVYTKSVEIEGVKARLVDQIEEVPSLAAEGIVPVVIDPQCSVSRMLNPIVLVDARMTKREPEIRIDSAALVIGLGPGFVAGKNCHTVVETLRGHNLGRVFWEGAAASDTGLPGSFVSLKVDRVLRAPTGGNLAPRAEIGQRLKNGDLIATVSGIEVRAGFDGVLRGLIHPSVELKEGMKIGDLDPRDDPSFCYRVSDKALAVAGGVLEAVLTRPEIRRQVWA